MTKCNFQKRQNCNGNENAESRRFTRREMTKVGLVQSWLDYFLVPIHLLYDFKKQDIAPGMKSDHSLVYFLLKINYSDKPGRGFFKFNCSLLKDNDYITIWPPNS